MPAQAGIQLLFRGKLDPSFRWGDERREDETFSIKKVSSQKRRRADRGFREQDMKKSDFEGLLKALSETKASVTVANNSIVPVSSAPAASLVTASESAGTAFGRSGLQLGGSGFGDNNESRHGALRRCQLLVQDRHPVQ